MIVQVVFGAVLIVLGLCALLGLPAISLRLQRRDARANALEKALIADVHKIESKIEHVYDDEIASRLPSRDATESDAAYH
jgi:hypothetical protein